MSKTYSAMLPLGTPAPEFILPDVTNHNKPVSLASEESIKATVILFICNHCPYVKHVNAELIRLANDYISRDVRFIAINANDIDSYPDDSPEKMQLTAIQLGYPFPYLFDETQEVADAYKATCTPDFFVFDSNLRLAYRGQLDDSRPGNNQPTDGHCIRAALDCLINNQTVDDNQLPSMGCNIKWKKPN
jgi:thiol-disulfide isomerase/thioredoxin